MLVLVPVLAQVLTHAIHTYSYVFVDGHNYGVVQQGSSFERDADKADHHHHDHHHEHRHIHERDNVEHNFLHDFDDVGRLSKILPA
jgi:hypothetical protein